MKIWIVNAAEPVFYQASYIASDLLTWKVPKWESAPVTGPPVHPKDEASGK